MNFSDFLKGLKTKQNFSSTRELYEFLGGEKFLEMSLRNFQLVESGTRPPSEKFFRIMITKIPREEYRNAVIAYFSTHLSPECEEFLTYLNQHLSHPINRENKSLFDSDRPTMMYSEEQLNYLTHNADAMRLHHRIMLWEKIESEKLVGKQELVDELVRLSLVERTSWGIKSSRTVFRVPSYENSPPSAVRRANRYLYTSLNSYLSEEGAENQQVSFAFQLVTKENAIKILDQVLSLKKWIQSISEFDLHADLVPFLYLGFGKQLESREL